MRKIITLLLIVSMLAAPIGARAALAEDLDYDNTGYSFDITKDKSSPGSWQSDERYSLVATYAPKIHKVVKDRNSVKVTAEITSSPRVIMIQWYDGKKWTTGAYSNAPCNGPIICSNDSQIKLENDIYSSWIEIRVTQGTGTLYRIRKYHRKDLNAANALCIDDFLLDRIRALKSVQRKRTFNIPGKAKIIRMRAVYTGFKGKNSVSKWVEVKVR